MNIFLETDRLILKAPQESDFEDLLRLRSDPNVMRYVGNGKIQTKEEVQRFLYIAMDYQQKHGFGFCSVFEKKSGKFIGQAGLFHLGFDDSEDEIEVAYRLAVQYWGQGYATELAGALIAWGFQHLPVEKLVALAWLDNIASQRVLEKVGMSHKKIIQFRSREIFHYEIYKNDAIELEKYDPNWVQRAVLEINQLRTLLASSHILDIQHVGSTSIPGVISKPIIDIQIAVDSLEAIKKIAIPALKSLDYVYWAENPDPTRLFFVKGMPPFGDKRTFHIHIYEITSRHWQEKIKFRDYLLTHPETAKAYANLKIELSEKYRFNREKYTEAKTEFILDVLKKS